MHWFSIICILVYASAISAQERVPRTIPTGAPGYREPRTGVGVLLDADLVPTSKSRVLLPGTSKPVRTATLNTQFVLDASTEEQTSICYNNFQLSVQSMFGDGGIRSASSMAQRSKVVGSTLYFLASLTGLEEGLENLAALDPQFEKDLATWNELEDAEEIRRLVAHTYGRHYVSHVQYGVKLSVACRSTSVESGVEHANSFAADFSSSFGMFGKLDAKSEDVSQAIQKLSRYSLEIRSDLYSGGIKKRVGAADVDSIGALTMTTLEEVHELLQGLRNGLVKIEPAAVSTVLQPILGVVPAKYRQVREALAIAPTPTIEEQLQALQKRIAQIGADVPYAVYRVSHNDVIPAPDGNINNWEVYMVPAQTAGFEESNSEHDNALLMFLCDVGNADDLSKWKVTSRYKFRHDPGVNGSFHDMKSVMFIFRRQK